jgi:hypothetical protein
MVVTLPKASPLNANNKNIEVFENTNGVGINIFG